MKKLITLLALFLLMPLKAQEKDGISLIFNFENTLKHCSQEFEKISKSSQETLKIAQEVLLKSGEPTILTGNEARKTIKTAGLVLSGTGALCVSSWYFINGLKRIFDIKQQQAINKNTSDKKALSSVTQWDIIQPLVGLTGIFGSFYLIAKSDAIVNYFTLIEQETT